MSFNLLIVDDEPLVRRGIKELIDFEKISIKEVRDASDGLEALDISKVFKPDIVIADINMPTMDGLTFSRELKKILPKVHLIILTGYDQYEYTREAIKIGVDDYILKPLSRMEIEKLLQETINKLLDDQNSEEIKKSISKMEDLTNISYDDKSYKIRIQQIMNENYTNPDFTLNELSNLLYLSNGHLSRLFGALFKKKFPDYLVELRLEHAKLLIIGTELKMYEISRKCGYNDPNYFSSAFKKKYNLSPNQYREIAKGGSYEA